MKEDITPTEAADAVQAFLFRWQTLVFVASVLIISWLLYEISQRLKEIAAQLKESQQSANAVATQTDARLDRLAEIVEKHVGKSSPPV